MANVELENLQIPLVIGDQAGGDTLTIGTDGSVTMTDLTASKVVATNGSKKLVSATGTVPVCIAISMFDALPERANESNWNGGLLMLSEGDDLDSGDDIEVDKGTGKIVLVVQAGSDLAGDITITGDTVDRDTGVITPGDTDTITIAGASTDNSSTAGKGNAIPVHDFTDAYITNKWFTGTVVLSTAAGGSGGVVLTDVDVYHCSFEQVNDQSNLTLDTFDANIFTTGTSAEFDCYLYTMHKDAGNKCHVDNHGNLSVGTDGPAGIADRYWRLRKGAIGESLDGATDGFWCDVYYLNSPVQVEDVTLKVWFTKTATVTFA